MKIIRENNDLTIGLNLELYKINYSLVQSINFIFYTDNVFMGVYKTMEDVDIYNNIKLQWNDLKQMKSGVIQYSYTITLIDNTQYSYNVITDYYLCNNIVEDKPNDDEGSETPPEDEPTETRPFYRIGYTEGMPQFILDGEEYAKKIYDEWDVNKTNVRFDFNDDLNIIFFPLIDTSNVTSMTGMFSGCKSLQYVPAINTSNVTNMQGMFSDCYSLISLDLSSFDTSKVTNMQNMFNGCKSLSSLDLSSFDTSNVTNMSWMFEYCSGLTSLDLSSFDTSNVTDMYYMFQGCSGLISLDLSSFDTSNVTRMEGMFSNCNKLTSLDLSSFDTSKVTNMSNMFKNCGGLTSLDLSSFDTSKVTNMNYLIDGSSGITKIDGLLSIKAYATTTLYYYSLLGFGTYPNLRKIALKDIGYNSPCQNINMTSATNWGVDSEDVPDARKSLTDSLIGYSFNRLMYGYPTCTVTLAANTKALLTSNEIAQITAKGFTIA